jgi:hypothetical protein
MPATQSCSLDTTSGLDSIPSMKCLGEYEKRSGPRSAATAVVLPTSGQSKYISVRHFGRRLPQLRQEFSHLSSRRGRSRSTQMQDFRTASTPFDDITIRIRGRLHRPQKNSEFGGQVSGHDLGRADQALFFFPDSASADDRALAWKSFSAAYSVVPKRLACKGVSPCPPSHDNAAEIPAPANTTTIHQPKTTPMEVPRLTLVKHEKPIPVSTKVQIVKTSTDVATE